MADLNDNLPPGWECKIDDKTGKFYFINHYTRTTSWDDPRMRHRPLQSTPRHITNMSSEYIPLQHGSPDLRRNYVYPSQSSPIQAFQIPGQPGVKTVSLQEFRSTQRSSPLTVRSNRVQDSSMTILPDSDDAVAKINTMFPTVSETHIRMLMKKYHSREALVISALQVEKNPITTPGPFATPPPQRNIHPGMFAPLHMTPPLGVRGASRGGSPVLRPGSGANSIYAGSPRIGDGYRSSPRSHSSPKLKLSCRYMKSIFPQAEETVILEILQNNDNNIQKTSDVLKDMGFNKKDTVKAAQQKLEAKREEEEKVEEAKAEKVATPVPVLKTAEEKETMKNKLKEKYKDVPDHLIKIALESVHFDESRAAQILQIMVQEDNERNDQVNAVNNEEQELVVEIESSSMPTAIPISQSRMSIKSLLKSEKTDKDKTLFNRIIENDGNFKSPYLSNTTGPTYGNAKGPNEELLLEDYVKWQGTNLNHRKGPQGLAKGSDKSLLSARSYKPQGANLELRKGPKLSLAKGSIFSQLKTVFESESRGK